MRINEEQRFFKQLYQACEKDFHNNTSATKSLQELLVDKIDRAVNRGAVSDEAAREMSNSLGSLTERTVEQLTQAEKKKVLAAITRISRGIYEVTENEEGPFNRRAQ